MTLYLGFVEAIVVSHDAFYPIGKHESNSLAILRTAFRYQFRKNFIERWKLNITLHYYLIFKVFFGLESIGSALQSHWNCHFFHFDERRAA